MGVKGLGKLIRSKIPSAIQTISLASLRDQKIAIDANYFFNKYHIGYNSIPASTRPPDRNEHIERKFHQQYMHLRRYRIQPIFFFDGRVPDLKKDEIAHRRIRLQRRNGVSIKQDDYAKLRQALIRYRIPYIDCPTEADFIMAVLSQTGYIHGIISDDMDMLPLGCTHLYRGYTTRSETLEYYNLSIILSQLTMTGLIDLCIYLGCDYGFRIQEYVYECNTIDVLDLFKTYNTIERIVEHFQETGRFRLDKIEARDPTYFETYQATLKPIRELFQCPYNDTEMKEFIAKNRNIL